MDLDTTKNARMKCQPVTTVTQVPWFDGNIQASHSKALRLSWSVSTEYESNQTGGAVL